MEATVTEFLDLPGGRIAYDVTGEGPLVVCVHGMGDIRGTFRLLTPRLTEAGYRVATMDIRGHGQSSTGWALPWADPPRSS
jgi:pimeloyl-ACP methyl ester carboxylesterase